MSTYQLKGVELNLFREGAKRRGAFGSVIELLVSSDAASFRQTDFDYKKILLVGEDMYFFGISDRFRLFDEEGNELDTRALNLRQSDHHRTRDLLNILGYPDKNNEVTVVVFGINSISDYCENCYYDKACKTAGCGQTFCDWDSDTCEDEYDDGWDDDWDDRWSW
jgi:hypothetical protein